MDMIETAIDLSIYAFLFLIGLGMVRVVIGPRVEDRMIGLNLVSGNILVVLVLTAFKVGKPVFLDVALVYAILGFVGTLALAQMWKKAGE